MSRSSLEVDGVIRDHVGALAQAHQLPAGLQAGGGTVENGLHLCHELTGCLQTWQVRIPRRRSPLLRLTGQLGDDVGDAGDVGGERQRLEVKDQLTLCQE